MAKKKNKYEVLVTPQLRTKDFLRPFTSTAQVKRFTTKKTAFSYANKKQKEKDVLYTSVIKLR